MLTTLMMTFGPVKRLFFVTCVFPNRYQRDVQYSRQMVLWAHDLLTGPIILQSTISDLSRLMTFIIILLRQKYTFLYTHKHSFTRQSTKITNVLSHYL